MLRISLPVIFYCLLFWGRAGAQVFPKENSVVNYRLVGFSFVRPAGAHNSLLEIANGKCKSTKEFDRNIIKGVPVRQDRVIVEVPAFGSDYTWRLVDERKGAKRMRGDLHHFSTGAIPESDTSKVRLRIIHPATGYSDAFVFADGNRIMYDMQGRPVWYLPEVPGEKRGSKSILRDIKLSPFGTITFLMDEQAYEVNYQGAVLWRAPDHAGVGGDTTEHYHHEFTRLKNKHYMVLGNELPLSKQKGKQRYQGSDTFYNNLSFGTVIEYDEKGSVVWSWKSSGYFLGSDIKYFNMPASMPVLDVHENAFYFDEGQKVMYVSFRHISRILKIKYPEGNVLAVYGERFENGVPNKVNSIFCGQHSCRLSQNGLLYLFNNGCDPERPPKVSMLREPGPGNEHLKAEWEYECNLDGLKQNHHRVFWYALGGSVTELPDGSIFVCSGSDYSKLFIVSRNKQEVWSAVPEKWDAGQKDWEIISQYRGSIIKNNKELENLIWNSVPVAKQQ